jgi:TolB-like protein/Flp pilus assembly protein TadD
MPNTVRFDCYEVDLPAGQLYKHGIRISLRDKSFQVLAALLEHPGEMVTREDLRRRLWREEVFVDFDNNLNTAIARLREALGDSADHPRFVETLPKRGYRFLGSVSETLREPEKGTAKRARLVVLPFLNLGGDPAQEYFSDAITDEIISALAGVAPEQLAVIARTTAMHYKGSHKDVVRIGRELGVDYVVEGGVHRSEDQVGINVQLIQVNDQTHLYAKKFNAELRDIFSLQNGIAREIAAHLNLGPRTDKSRAGSAVFAAARKPTEDLTAYNLYLQGRHHLYRWTTESAQKAKHYFERAIARDPEFALAYDSLGELYWSLGFYGFIPPKEACSVGLCYALRAVEIDNDLAETHALLGRYRKQVDFNWPEAQREMTRALELNPISPVVRQRYATSYLMAQGRLTEAAAELEGILEYDPMDLNVRCWLGVLHYLGYHYDCAVDQLRLVLEVDPNYALGHLVLGQTRLMEHKFEEAVPVFRKTVELYGSAPMVLGWLGLALAQSGNVSEARSLLRDLHAIASGGYVPRTSFAWIHFGLGEVDDAFVWMDRAIEARDHMMTPIKTYPFLDPLRSDPRFSALLRKMNLEP